MEVLFKLHPRRPSANKQSMTMNDHHDHTRGGSIKLSVSSLKVHFSVSVYAECQKGTSIGLVLDADM